MSEYSICWNEKKTVGVIVVEDYDHVGLTYELRKGALNSLGVVTPDFVEAWAEMTAEDNCTIEKIEIPENGLELAVKIIEARLPLYKDIGQINALKECISCLKAAGDK